MATGVKKMSPLGVFHRFGDTMFPFTNRFFRYPVFLTHSQMKPLMSLSRLPADLASTGGNRFEDSPVEAFGIWLGRTHDLQEKTRQRNCCGVAKAYTIASLAYNSDTFRSSENAQKCHSSLLSRFQKLCNNKIPFRNALLNIENAWSSYSK